jgi:hypothetical protein
VTIRGSLDAPRLTLWDEDRGSLVRSPRRAHSRDAAKPPADQVCAAS